MHCSFITMSSFFPFFFLRSSRFIFWSRVSLVLCFAGGCALCIKKISRVPSAVGRVDHRRSAMRAVGSSNFDGSWALNSGP